MNLGRVSQVLAGFVAFFTLAQCVPLMLALSETPWAGGSARVGFIASIVLGCVVVLLLWVAGRGAPRDFYRKEAICVAGIAWFLASMLGAVPFVWSGMLPDPADALFES
ncbi:MAG TPA: hypothetical protein VFD82_16985, partial [Planctomycetota bacterium]|nr:hypothetical protein [Planctomycetota bacterium]